MMDIRQVIVPVDLQRHTDALAAFALRTAAQLGARVTLVHVVREVEYYSDYDSSSFEEFEARNRRAVEERLAALLAGCRRTCPDCAAALLSGDPADAIVGYARDNDIDLIIMATHGAKGLDKILLGSVADRVVKRATCPVLLFNPYRHRDSAAR